VEDKKKEREKKKKKKENKERKKEERKGRGSREPTSEYARWLLVSQSLSVSRTLLKEKQNEILIKQYLVS